MKSARGLARLDTKLHRMVLVTPVLYEPFTLDSAINKTVSLGVFFLPVLVVYLLSLPASTANDSSTYSSVPGCNSLTTKNIIIFFSFVQEYLKLF